MIIERELIKVCFLWAAFILVIEFFRFDKYVNFFNVSVFCQIFVAGLHWKQFMVLVDKE